jgi:hypothetical protein
VTDTGRHAAGFAHSFRRIARLSSTVPDPSLRKLCSSAFCASWAPLYKQDTQISVALLRYLAKERAVPGRYLLRQSPAALSSTARGGLQPMPLASPWKRRRSRRQPARPCTLLVGVRGLVERGLIEGPPHQLETDRHPARGEAAWDRERWKTGE